jgi:hypothetical protein
MTKDMKLSASDKKVLLQFGYCEQDLAQIEEAIEKTEYILCDRNGNGEKKISPLEAQKRLSQKSFLSGLSRSAFHASAAREYGKRKTIFFDSRALWK